MKGVWQSLLQAEGGEGSSQPPCARRRPAGFGVCQEQGSWLMEEELLYTRGTGTGTRGCPHGCARGDMGTSSWMCRGETWGWGHKDVVTDVLQWDTGTGPMPHPSPPEHLPAYHQHPQLTSARLPVPLQAPGFPRCPQFPALGSRLTLTLEGGQEWRLVRAPVTTGRRNHGA